MVPEALDEQAAAGGPDVIGGAPDPVRPVSNPIARPPQVAGLGVNPAARHIDAVGIRGFGGWPLVCRWRRRRQVVQFGGVGAGPEAVGPLPAGIHLLPMAADP